MLHAHNILLILSISNTFLHIKQVSCLQCSYNTQRHHPKYLKSFSRNIGRSSFLKILSLPTIKLIITPSNPLNAIEFVPSSPSYTGTYNDAKEILYTQRIAIDNIAQVISDGNLDEAGFKIMQLSAQTNTAGKIILSTFQEKLGSTDGIQVLKFLSCQKKFALLLEHFDKCDISLRNALRGKFGVTAIAQIRLSSILEETKLAYDEFLRDVEMIELEHSIAK